METISINEAINGVRAMARQADALAKIVTVLDNIDSLQNAAESAQAAYERVKGQLDSEQAALQAVRETAAKTRADAQALFQKATDDANALLADAQHQAGQGLATARTQAEEIVGAATQQAAETRAAAQADLDAINLSRIDAARELESINEKLAQAREKVQALLGG